MSLLKVYIIVHKFDIICLSNTYLDSGTRHDDDNSEIAGNNTARADDSANAKLERVCIYYKKCLPLRVLSVVFLNEFINSELRIGDNTCNCLVLYRLLSQSQDIFESFCKNFERTLETFTQNNPSHLVAAGNFNA